MLDKANFGPRVFAGKASVAHAEPVSLMEEDAFRSFYLEVAQALLGYLRKTCGNAALAEDVFQEAFYRFLRADLLQRDPPQMKAYLFKTATSLLVDHWRREKRERSWKSAWNPPAVQAAEKNEDLPQALSELRPVDRALLWLAYVEGFDHGEIASALRLRENSVRVLLFRARNKLARLLGRRAFKQGTRG
jgi:RNA polymerase sigma-70 factor (ECF subfamily)